jgi:hypothetical protein
MDYIKRFNTIMDLTKNDTYVINRGHSNILFLGSCRTIVLSMFFEYICKTIPYFIHAQFGIQSIAVHVLSSLNKTKSSNMTSVIENADIIVCEQIRHYNILNTSEKCVNNIFNQFNIKPNCKIIQIPNLEYFKNSDNIINIDRLANHCKKYNFICVSNMILNNPLEELFATCNHPKTILILELFTELCSIYFNQTFPIECLNHLNKIKIFT